MLITLGLTGLFVATYGALGWFRDLALRCRVLLDVPNERSNHHKLTVRGAGAIFAGVSLCAWWVLSRHSGAPYLHSLILGSAIVAGVSFFDDIAGLRIRTRLISHLIASLIFLSAVPVPSFLENLIGPFAIIWIPLAAFFMVAVINIYNFMDGIDGLAGLHSLCVLFGWVLFSGGGIVFNSQSLLCLGLAFPLLAFLIRNWHPAQLFMGDVGSTFLGFFFAALAVIHAPGIMRSTKFLSLIMLMMPFLFDATFTLIVRLLNGEVWYHPHSSHLFQRLVRRGLGHARVATIYGAMTIYMGILVALSTQGAIESPFESLILYSWPYMALYFYTVRLERGAFKSREFGHVAVLRTLKPKVGSEPISR